MISEYINHIIVNTDSFAEKIAFLKVVLNFVVDGKIVIFCTHKNDAYGVHNRLKLDFPETLLMTNEMLIDEKLKLLSLIKCDNSEVSRSIDIPFVKIVINFECPMIHRDENHYFDFKSYIYRSGRAARGSNTGAVVLTLANSNDPVDMVKELDQQFCINATLLSREI